MVTGRPSVFTQEIADQFCATVATTTRSLKWICENNDIFPHVGTVLRWLRENEDFRNQYARAKEDQADLLAEEMMDIADETSNDTITDEKGNEYANKEWINRSRLRVDTRKWIASKLKPKKYGDRVAQEISGPNGEPLPAPVLVFQQAPNCNAISDPTTE